jgi:glycosyltransferase involved in cell wall biosynthesis
MITVIIPFFNAAKTIEKCLDSLIKQSFVDFEVILVNDHSNDDSEKIIHQYTITDQRFHLIEQTPNQKGPSSARNLGLANAKGDYIYFVDADDWIEPSTFEKMLFWTEQPNIDLICSSHFQDFGDDHRPKKDGTPENNHLFSTQELHQYISQYLYQPYIYTMLVHCWGKLYNKKVIDDHHITFNELLSQLEDVDFNFRYLSFAKSVAYTNGFLYHHSQNINQSSLSKLTGTENTPIPKYLKAFSAIENYLAKRDKEKQINAEKEVSRLFINTIIITLIRLSKKMLKTPSREIIKRIFEIAKSGEVSKRLHHYQPNENESKLLYLALKTKIPVFVFLAGLIRASVLLLTN